MQRDEKIRHYTIPELLPAGHTLALNVFLGTLVLIAQDTAEPYPRLVAEQQFTSSELSLVLPLLNAHPNYCPYEILLASFDHRVITQAAIERCRERLREALEEGQWDYTMRPVRNVLSRTRLKLRSFGIEVNAILEIGYCLLPLPARRKRWGA